MREVLEVRIKAIRYSNFRNFADQGEVRFNTDGKVTVVYGTNGDGKTTLHQLFQWVLYKKVNFNKTTSEAKLYNLGRGERLQPECFFLVWGEIEFEHDGDDYIASLLIIILPFLPIHPQILRLLL